MISVAVCIASSYPTRSKRVLRALEAKIVSTPGSRSSFEKSVSNLLSGSANGEFTGKIVGDSLKFKGQFESFSGFLKLNLDN